MSSSTAGVLALAPVAAGRVRPHARPGAAAAPDVAPQVVRVGAIGPMALRAGWLLLETALIPMALLYTGLRLGGPTVGLTAVLVWRLGLTLGRVAAHQRVPTTVVLSTSIFCIRTVVSLAFASVYIYLWQPVIMSAVMGFFFIATAVLGKPITMKLAQDVVTLPEVLQSDARVRRIFAEIAHIWGWVHVVCAGIGAYTLNGRAETVVLVHGALGIICTVASVGGCIVWGWWRLRRLPGIKIRLGAPEEVDPLADLPRAA